MLDTYLLRDNHINKYQFRIFCNIILYNCHFAYSLYLLDAGFYQISSHYHKQYLELNIIRIKSESYIICNDSRKKKKITCGFLQILQFLLRTKKNLLMREISTFNTKIITNIPQIRKIFLFTENPLILIQLFLFRKGQRCRKNEAFGLRSNLLITSLFSTKLISKCRQLTNALKFIQ